MLTEPELRTIIVSVVENWKRYYPTPWPAAHFVDGFYAPHVGNSDITPWGIVLKAMLPGPDWVDWFISTLMYEAWHRYGEAACVECRDHCWKNLHDNMKHKAHQNLIEWGQRELDIITKFWFPNWTPPENPPAFFPTRGVSPKGEYR